jgi:hypothetical protein
MDTKLMEEFEELEGQLADVDESKVGTAMRVAHCSNCLCDRLFGALGVENRTAGGGG